MKRVFLLAAVRACMAVASGQGTGQSLLESYRKILETSRNNSLAHYKIGEIFLADHNYQSAANEFREALSGDLEPKEIEVWAHLNLGKIFELTGQRDRASNEYKLAQRTNDSSLGAVDTLGMGPRLIKKTEPEYSDEARLAGLEGTILLSGVVGEDGLLRNLAVIRGLGLGLDEKAVESVNQWVFAPGMYQGRTQAMYATFEVDFFLPAKQSRWHLTRAAFGTPAGASRPTVVSAEVPPGAGVLRDDAIEEGRLLGAVGRQATATVVLQVNEQGIPVNVQVRDASEEVWEAEALALVRKWRFTPGLKEGRPISVPCVLDLVWGPKNLTPGMMARLRDAGTGAGTGVGVATSIVSAKDVAGKTLVFSGYVKTEGVTRGWAGLWWRVDGAVMVAPDSSAAASGWKRVELTIPVAADARSISFGALYTGDGTAWFDGLSIQLNGTAYTSDFAPDLDFESATLDGFLAGSTGYEVQLDNQTFRTGKQSLRIRHLPDASAR